jgi:hypothetical protein
MNILSTLAADRRIRFLAQITCAPYRPISTSSSDTRRSQP